MDFIYERFRTPSGVKLEVVTGGSHYKGKVWRQIAMQVYCENGKEDFRDIGHFKSGAPFIYGADERISISHTEGCLVVATIPVPDDAILSEFSSVTALGVDVERADREKVVKLRDRFLSESELAIVPADSVSANVTAWTCKEAMLKAGMDPAINWHTDIIITTLPAPDVPGSGFINLSGTRHDFSLHTLLYDDFIISLARTPK